MKTERKRWAPVTEGVVAEYPCDRFVQDFVVMSGDVAFHIIDRLWREFFADPVQRKMAQAKYFLTLEVVDGRVVAAIHSRLTYRGTESLEISGLGDEPRLVFQKSPETFAEDILTEFPEIAQAFADWLWRELYPNPRQRREAQKKYTLAFALEEGVVRAYLEER